MRKTSANLKGLVVCFVVVVIGPFVSVFLVASVMLRSAFKDVAGAGVDPSQKARLLAEGISNAMNGFAAGISISALALVGAAVFGVRLYRERKANGS